jgi:hypothetical protein
VAVAPIFIVGCPRSGTTLLRNMLNRHPAIAICFETHFLDLVYRRRRAFGDLSRPENRKLLLREYLASERIVKMELDLPALRETLLREGTSYEAFLGSLLRFYAQAHGKRRCGDKTPQHALFTETLCQWFPGASILHTVRDPRDVVASLMRMPWAPASVLKNARTWLSCNLAALRSRGRPEYLQVRYETLATQPEPELRRICQALGEEYSSEMLAAPEDAPRSSPWLQLAEKPVTDARLGTWREQLDEEQVAIVEWISGPLMHTLGYPPVGQAPSRLGIARAFAEAAGDVVRRNMGEFPAAWYHFTRSASISKQEAAIRRYRQRRNPS